MKMYMIRLKYGTMIKNLYFQGEDDLETKQQWEIACQQLEDVKKSSKDEIQYIENAKQHFKKCGFQRIIK